VPTPQSLISTTTRNIQREVALVSSPTPRSSSLYQPETEEEEEESGSEEKPEGNDSDKTYSVDEEVDEEEAEELNNRDNNHDDNSDSEIEEEVNL